MKTVLIAAMMPVLLFCCALKPLEASVEYNYNTPKSTVIFWTDGPKLKAVNLTFFPNHSGPVGIVSVPLYVCLNGGKDKETLTVAKYYQLHGRETLIRHLEKLLGSPVETYISIDQKTLVDASEVVGHFNMAGVTTDLAGVFEGRYPDGPENLQVEIRQLAGALMTTAMLVKLPRVLWIFATQVDTDIGPAQFLNFFRLLKKSGPEVLQKKAVPGYDIRIENGKYRVVKPEMWANTVKDVTIRR